MKNRSFVLFFTFLFLVSVGKMAHSANFYVDNSVSSSGNGTSWASAWKNFSNIVWSSIKPGDTLYISGGSPSQTYNETLTVGAGGSSGSPITITKGVDADRNGEVIIDGQSSRQTGVDLNGKNDVAVQNLNVRNITDAGMWIRNVTSGVIIQNNSVYSGDPGVPVNARGYDVRDSKGTTPVIVRHNSYSTPTSSTAQNDGIWSSGNDGVVFQGNTLVISNSYQGPNDGHNDCLQSYTDINIFIIANYCEQNNTKTSNAQGLWICDISGTATIINNVVYAPNTYDSLIYIKNDRGSGYSGNIVAYNNTAYGSRNGTGHIDNSPNSIFKNNILIPQSGWLAFAIDGIEPAKTNIECNLIYSLNYYSAYMSYANKFTCSQWQASGYEADGMNADPKFTNLSGKDFTLTSASPAIDKGMTLSQVMTDKNGTPRPQGAAYDIGAYEYGGNASSDTQPPPSPPANTSTQSPGIAITRPTYFQSDRE